MIIEKKEECKLFGWNELSAHAKEEFDWIKPEKVDQYEFFMFDGADVDDVYCTCEFMRITRSVGCPFPEEWDGYKSESFFSGVLIAYPKDDEICDPYVIAARYCT